MVVLSSARCLSILSMDGSHFDMMIALLRDMFVKLVVAGHWKFFCKDTKKYLDNQIFGRLFLDYFITIQEKTS